MALNPNTAEKKRTVPAENFMQTLNANVDNERLSDVGFREMVRNTIPVVIFRRIAARSSNTYVGQASPKAGVVFELTLAVRQQALDLHRERYMAVLELFSMESFSAACLSKMPKSRLQELLEEIRRPG